MSAKMAMEWQVYLPGMWRRDDPTGTVSGYFLREGLPLASDGTPSARLARGWERHRRAGVTCWWRIDGPEEEWRPAGNDVQRSSEHVGWHICAVDLGIRGHELGPCPECARINARAATEAA